MLLFADTSIAPPYLWSSLRWTSSWWLCPVASLWTLSPLRSWIGFNLNPIFWLSIPDATSGSETGPRLGSWLTARVDVHLRRLPRLGLGLLKVPLSLGDPGSLAAKDDLSALLRALAGNWDVDIGPRAPGVRLAERRAPSWPTLHPISFCSELSAKKKLWVRMQKETTCDDPTPLDDQVYQGFTQRKLMLIISWSKHTEELPRIFDEHSRDRVRRIQSACSRM